MRILKKRIKTTPAQQKQFAYVLNLKPIQRLFMKNLPLIPKPKKFLKPLPRLLPCLTKERTQKNWN